MGPNPVPVVPAMSVPSRPHPLPLRTLLAPVVPAVMLAAALATAGGAQELRTVESSRQLRDTLPLTVSVTYGAGRVSLRPTSEPLLYAASLRYDPERAAPRMAYDSSRRTLELGIKGSRDVRVSNVRDAGSLDVRLSERVPMDLQLALGAVESDLDLGGLSLSSVELNVGASEARVRFGAPNRRLMRRLEINAGAGDLRVGALANAAAPEIALNAGVGSTVLDFSGVWTQDVALEASFAMGGLTLRVPRGVGVRVEMSRFLASFEREGFRKVGDAWVSDDWERAPHKLRVKASSAFSKLRIERE